MSYDPDQPTYGPPEDASGPRSYGQQPYGQPQQPPTGYIPPPYGPEYVPPQQQPPYQQPPYQQQQYGMPPIPNYAPPQPPKKSLRWLWITLGIIGGIIVLSCIGCAVASAFGISFLAKTVGQPAIVASSYYQAIKQQDYAKAFTYLDTSAISLPNGQQATQVAFTTAGQVLDQAQGVVTNYTPSNIQTNNGIATITMTVTRQHSSSSYQVHLELKQQGNDWKITSIDNI
jgi:hypothetical protein